ncbi:MAG TPA: hypothetical protein VID04_01490 [Methylomirabilota bacterium]|jgi:hypothetical protein
MAGRVCAGSRRWPLRPLLRWTSLIGSAALLAYLGSTNTHQRDFTLFLVSVLGLAALAVTVFVLTAPRGGPDPE